MSLRGVATGFALFSVSVMGWAGPAAQKTIQLSFTAVNKTNLTIDSAELWAYAPIQEVGAQTCQALRASHPYEMTETSGRNQVMRFSVGPLAPYGQRIVRITAEMAMAGQSQRKRLSRAELKPYLRPEKWIESHEPGLQQLAKKLTKKSRFQTARHIHEWVSQNLEYAGVQKQARGASYALAHKKGDCTDYMYLFIALCRAAKVPARGIGGYICPESRVLRPSDYHNWAEFYHKGRWHVSDPQRNVFLDPSQHYVAFRILNGTGNDFHRFKYAGDGLTVYMNGSAQ